MELFPGALVRTDVDEFLDVADAALAAGDPVEVCDAALRYAGELLPGTRYEAWADGPRRLLAARHLELLRVGGQWERVLELDPLDEAAARQVMRAALDEGRRHHSIAVYGRLRAALSIELGVLPQPTTEELYARSLEGLIPASPSLIGRDEEMATVEALMRQPQGSPLVVVRGPVGIGKSSFVGALVERVRAGGGAAALVLADEPDDAFATLAAVVEELLLRVPSAAERLNDRTRTVLARLRPVVQSPDSTEVPFTRHQMLGAVQRLLDVAGERVVIVVDDAHRADDSSLGVLAQLTERAEGGPVVVFSFRAEAVGPGVQHAIARAARHHAPTTIDLGPLDRDGLRAIAASLGASTDDDAIAALAAASEGNAFFATELCRAGLIGNELRTSLTDAIGRRCLDFDDDVVAWLRRLALITGPLDLESVVAITGCSDDELTRLLDTALATGVLAARNGQYRFGHELVRRTLSDQLPPHHAVAVHRDAARRLTELGARPGAVAHHWLEGRRPERAAEWLLRAADDAVGLGGYPAAVVYLDRIIEHDSSHAEALRRRATALDAMGDTRAIAAYDDAVPRRDDGGSARAATVASARDGETR